MPTEVPGRKHVIEARLQAFLQLLPATQFFTVVDAALLCWYFWTDRLSGFLVGWVACVVAHALAWGFYALRNQGAHPENVAGRTRNVVIQSFSEAALFSTFIIVVFPGVELGRTAIMGAFITGMLAAGALSRMTIPRAAYVFIGGISLGAGVGLILSPLPSPGVVGLLIGALAVAMATLVRTMSAGFDTRATAEFELSRQKTLVSDLLDDFGESTSEGLWETDARGRLDRVTARLAALAGRPADELTGRPLTSADDWSTLVIRGSAFRNIEVPVQTPRGRRWWSLTGKPLKESGRIVGWRGVASDVTDQRQQEIEMLRLSRFDSLTGLLNRGSFRTLVDSLFLPGMERVPRFLALIDMADFRDVNESRGHVFGDALLVQVASRLRNSLPESIVVSRLDGDEFAVQGALSDETATRRDLEDLMSHLVQPYMIASDRTDVGFRMGLAFTPSDATSPDQWFRCADLALRTAKTQGRNLILPFEPAMMDAFHERNALRSALRQALVDKELALVFQPIVHLASGRITGYEALVRWNHPSRGVLSPTVFIPLAEENEVILDVGLWVLEEACRTALAWPSSVSISVNVSGVQLRSGSWANDVETILARLNFDAHRLILEVTETALVKDDPDMLRTFATLRDRGVRWALDDFGTGYSSLAYLRDFPFDTLKIDQSFLRTRSSQGPSPALLGAIVALADSLGLTTTAEGIEGEDHRRLLESLGCDKGQGFLFSRPVAAAQVSHQLDLVFRPAWVEAGTH